MCGDSVMISQCKKDVIGKICDLTFVEFRNLQMPILDMSKQRASPYLILKNS